MIFTSAYTFSELTSLIKMSKRTITKWVEDGKIPHKMKKSRGGKKYVVEDIDMLGHMAKLPQVQGFFGILNDMAKKEPFLGEETIKDLLNVYFRE